MTFSEVPILYSYRRCPYAMRARMALYVAKIPVEIREISLRNKPAHMLQVSPKGTVPVLVLPNGHIIEQSIDIMLWALQQHDPEAWLDVDVTQLEHWVVLNDGPFKLALDRYKYPERYPENTQDHYRPQGESYLQSLQHMLQQHHFVLGNQPSIVDVAIFPFVRQFAAVDAGWFAASPYQKVAAWLSYWVDSELFAQVMQKYPTYLG
ncbi:MAG: glutathione S-transferase [Methylophilaceae bacterium 17-43-7]|nr:MAG: glutathione S-transferase [Methylophilaceae bacterium 17-43-7]